MDERLRGRLRLLLRSERALGLSAVKGFPRALLSAGPAVAPDRRMPMAGSSIRAAASFAPAAPGFGRTASPAAAPTRTPVAAATRTVTQAAPAPASLPANAPPFSSPPLPTEEKRRRLQVLDDTQVKGCKRCRLCETRTHTVFGEGNPDAEIFFIGEGPGEDEDLSGRPFVGRAGSLLTKMIGAMGLQREQVFIANIVKCRPPANRVPEADEVAACTPYLENQLETVRPKVVVTLGLPATRYMLQSNLAMGKLRGQFHQWRGIKLMPTYHPAYVLRSYTEATRAAVWSDLKQVMAELNLPGA